MKFCKSIYEIFTVAADQNVASFERLSLLLEKFII